LIGLYTPFLARDHAVAESKLGFQILLPAAIDLSLERRLKGLEIAFQTYLRKGACRYFVEG
jgi:hypothetical protein